MNFNVQDICTVCALSYRKAFYPDFVTVGT